ncbi:MAG: hypothetical protein EBU88_08480 [Acidobacteria bacterium]|nr:hypothetical protein [Acidobacteriota bacterium]
MNWYRAHSTSPMASFTKLWRNIQMVTTMFPSQMAGHFLGFFPGASCSLNDSAPIMSQSALRQATFNGPLRERIGSPGNSEVATFVIVVTFLFALLSLMVKCLLALLHSDVKYDKIGALHHETRLRISRGLKILACNVSLIAQPQLNQPIVKLISLLRRISPCQGLPSPGQCQNGFHIAHSFRQTAHHF